MEQQQQQEPLYDHRDETSPMEAALYGSAETGRGDDAYQYDPTFANYDLDQSQNYSTDGGIQYGDQQQPLYGGDQYAAAAPAGGEFYQPQLQSTNAYLDNDGHQQYQPKYDVQGDYKYQPEPEYEYKPYQGGQQRPPANGPVIPPTPPPAAAAQQSKPSYSSPQQSTGQQPPRTTAPAEQRGPVRSTTGAAKSTRVLPQSRTTAASAAASLSDRK